MTKRKKKEEEYELKPRNGQGMIKKRQYDIDAAIREKLGITNEIIDPTIYYPDRIKMPRSVKYRFNQKLAAEAALLAKGTSTTEMVVSISEREIPEDPNPVLDSDIVYTNMRYVLFKSNVISPNTHGMHHEALLTEDVFQIECDVLRPRRWIRVRNYEELLAIAAGVIPTKNGIDPKTVLWLVKNTQINRRMFIIAEMNINMKIPFTVDWERYIRARNDRNPTRPYCLRSPRMQIMEIVKEAIRNGNAVNLAPNRAFILQHSYQNQTCTWARQTPNFSSRIDGEAELAKLDNPKRYPIDYSDFDETYRNTVLIRKNKIRIQKNTWQGGKQNGAVPEKEGQDED